MDFAVAFYGLIAWIPLCVWILALVHWAIGGDIDLIAAVVGITAALVLGVIAVRPPLAILSPIACVAAYVTVGAYPLVAAASNRFQLKQLNVEEMADAYRAIGQNPGNPLAKFKLAKAAYKNGIIGHAVAVADATLSQVPRRIMEEECRMLEKWKRKGVPPETLRPIVCVECHENCLPGWTHCRNCGSAFLLQRAKGQILPGDLTRRLIAVWACAVLLIVGLPMAATLQPVLAVASMLAMILIAFLLTVLTFRKRTESFA